MSTHIKHISLYFFLFSYCFIYHGTISTHIKQVSLYIYYAILTLDIYHSYLHYFSINMEIIITMDANYYCLLLPRDW